MIRIICIALCLVSVNGFRTGYNSCFPSDAKIRPGHGQDLIANNGAYNVTRKGNQITIGKDGGIQFKGFYIRSKSGGKFISGDGYKAISTCDGSDATQTNGDVLKSRVTVNFKGADNARFDVAIVKEYLSPVVLIENIVLEA